MLEAEAGAFGLNHPEQKGALHFTNTAGKEFSMRLVLQLSPAFGVHLFKPLSFSQVFLVFQGFNTALPKL